MHTATLLGIAAALATVQYAAHATLFLRATPSHGQEEVGLVSAMKSRRWRFGGFERSYWDFYYGYGLLAILWGIVEVCLLWLLSRAALPLVTLRPLVATLLVANIGHAILTLRYFFLIPMVFDALIAIALAWVLFT